MSNPSQDLILITCASGKQASHILPLLSPTYTHLRLVVHSQSSASRLQSTYPSAEIITADLCSPTECSNILSGVTTVIHIGPSFHPHETSIGKFMIDAALSESQKSSSKFKHFIYSSVMHSQLQKLLNHDCKRYVEEYLIESGLNYTILQPTHFMDVFPLGMLLAEDNPVYKAMWSPESKFSFVALDDFAKAVKKVVDEREKHYLATYPLISSRTPVSYNEVCELASKVLGKNVRVERLSMDEAKGILGKGLGMNDSDMDPRVRDGLERLLLYYNRRGITGSANVLQWLIGEKTMEWEQMFALETERVRLLGRK